MSEGASFVQSVVSNLEIKIRLNLEEEIVKSEISPKRESTRMPKKDEDQSTELLEPLLTPEHSAGIMLNDIVSAIRDHSHNHGHSSHNHGHTHTHGSDSDDCCSDDDCQSKLLKPPKSPGSTHSHDHGHDHSHGVSKSIQKPFHGHDHTHSHHGHDHGHGHNSHASGCCESEDDCCDNDGCCSSNKALIPKNVSHDHGHGHDHAHGRGGGCCESEDDDCCDDDGCCSKREVNHDHGHDHSHSGGCCESEDDCCDDDGCCSTKKPVNTSHDHNHSHGHDHGHGHDHSHGGGCCESDKDDCCDDDGCCSSDKQLIPKQSMNHDHSHGHEHSVVTKSSSEPHRILSNDSQVVAESIEISIAARICSSCDPNSEIPHEIRVTRLRVANLCCAGEERIIRSSLGTIKGIEHIAVNVIGRYAVIKHCQEDCCAPVNTIVDVLNSQRLGVSVQEVGQNLEEESKGCSLSNYVDPIQLTHFLSMLGIFIAGLSVISNGEVNLTSMILFVIGTGIGIFTIIHGAFIAIFYRHTLDIHVLMLIAIIGAVISTEYFDACLLVTLFAGAELIEDMVMKTVRRAINSASNMHNVATMAVLVTPNPSGKGKKYDDIHVSKLQVGDIIACRAGDIIAIDGDVVFGDAVINESVLTGESIPIGKKVGAKVFGGTVVQNGYVEIKVTTALQDSVMNKLKQTVEDLSADRGNVAIMIDKFSAYWTPFVLLITFLLVVVGGGVSTNWHEYVNKGLVLLVLACPCAIVISVPIPTVCGIAVAAKHGVLIKGSSVIERLATVNSLAVDKTGTLTKGFCKVLSKVILSDATVDFNTMELAAAVESKSTHPLANAIVSDFCGCIAEYEATLPDTKSIKVIDGVGISAQVKVNEQWKPIVIGNERLLNDTYTIPSSPKDKAIIDKFLADNSCFSILIVVVDKVVRAVIAIADEIREESHDFVAKMKKLGLTVTMLTGDHKSVAEEVCHSLNIEPEHCKSRLLPEQKLQWIKDEQEQNNKKVLMIGDGINDATALAMATVGCAMGESGSAMTVQAGDLVIMSDNLLRIPSSIKFCKNIHSIVLENVIFSVLVKIISIVLAIIGMLSLWTAVTIDLGTLLIVILNGTRPLMSRIYNESNLDKFMKVPEV